MYKKTYRILQYDVLQEEYRWVLLPRCAAFDLMVEHGYDPEENIILVDAFLKKEGDNTPAFNAAQDRLSDMVKEFVPKPMSDKAIEFKVSQEKTEEDKEKREKALLATREFRGYGKLFVATAAGSSMIRKSGFIMAPAEVKRLIWDFAFSGVSVVGKKFAINKALSYCGLLFSASRPMSEVWGYDLDIDRVVVVDDGAIQVQTVADVIVPAASDKEQDEVLFDQERTLSVPIPDGQILIDMLVALRAGISPDAIPTGTLRACPLAVKGLGYHCDMQGFFKARGITQIVDIWGNAHNVDDVDVVMFKSCFKQAGITESWDEIRKEFKARNGHFRVCVQAHAPKPKRMSYQMAQTLVSASDSDIDYFAGIAEEKLAKYEDPQEAAKLLGGSLAKAALCNPALLKLRYSQLSAQKAYTARREQCLGGSIPEVGYYLPVVADPIICLEVAAGLKPSGSLKAGECVCFAMPEGEMAIARSPHLDHAHVILKNVPSKASRFFIRSKDVIIVNMHDDTTYRLRMDFDGDKVLGTDDPRILSLIRESAEMLGNRLVDWPVPEARKEPFQFWKMESFLDHNVSGNQIGTYANSLTRLWANYREIVDNSNTAIFRKAVAWLTYAGNVLIDAAKHGSVTIKKPSYVKAALSKVTGFVSDEASGEILEEEVIGAGREAFDNFTNRMIHKHGEHIQLDRAVEIYRKPEHIRHAKATLALPVNHPHWNRECEISTGVCDRYMRKVSERTAAELKVRGLEDLELKYEDFMFDPKRKTGAVPGLTGDDGLFSRLAFIRKDEYDGMTIDRACTPQWMSDKDVYTRKMLEVAIQASGNPEASWDAAYDIITRNLLNIQVYDPTRDGKYTCLFRTYFSVFGDTILRALEKNGFRLPNGASLKELDEEESEPDELDDSEE